MNLGLSCASKLQGTSKAPLILAVEDNEDNLLIIDYIVDSFNCQFIGESDGKRTLQIAKEFQPDLILLDIMLPDLSGFDILQCLKEDSLTRKIPVVAVTALAMKEDEQRIQDAGFDEYITKPFQLEDLEDIIRRYLPLR